jgi:putative tricarboxylic transport membrane protein
MSIFARIAAVAALGLAAAFATPGDGRAAEMETIHFLIPGGAGGGWDSTARGVGEALVASGLLGSASYENLSGGGGGVAIGNLIKTADRSHGTLMVNSTPIIVRSISKVFPFSFRDLTPIAGMIGDYEVLAVKPDSNIQSFTDVLEMFKADPSSVKIGGGSVRGDLDHIAVALAFKAAGEDPTKVTYVPYDAGGQALTGLLTGEVELLSTGLGEVIDKHRDGQIRIIAVAAPERVPGLDVATMKEQGVDSTFVNWRGFFGPPGLPEDEAAAYADLLQKLTQTDAWAEVRDRNGWTDIYTAGPDFVMFLEDQEDTIGATLKELGFAK